MAREYCDFTAVTIRSVQFVVCRYTRAYIHHLTKAGESMGGTLLCQHNVYYMNELMECIRRAIQEGTLDEEEDRWLAPGLRSRDFRRTGVDGGTEASSAGSAPQEWSGDSLVDEVAAPESALGAIAL